MTAKVTTVASKTSIGVNKKTSGIKNPQWELAKAGLAKEGLTKEDLVRGFEEITSGNRAKEDKKIPEDDLPEEQERDLHELSRQVQKELNKEYIPGKHEKGSVKKTKEMEEINKEYEKIILNGVRFAKGDTEDIPKAEHEKIDHGLGEPGGKDQPKEHKEEQKLIVILGGQHKHKSNTTEKAVLANNWPVFESDLSKDQERNKDGGKDVFGTKENFPPKENFSQGSGDIPKYPWQVQSKTNKIAYPHNFSYHRVTGQPYPSNYNKNPKAYIAVSVIAPKPMNPRSQEEDIELENELRQLKPWNHKQNVKSDLRNRWTRDVGRRSGTSERLFYRENYAP